MIEWLQTNQCIISSETKHTIHFLSQKNKCYSHLILLLHAFPAVLFSFSSLKSLLPLSLCPSFSHIYTHPRLTLLTHAPAAETSSISPRWGQGLWRWECGTFALLQGYSMRLFLTLGSAAKQFFFSISRGHFHGLPTLLPTLHRSSNAPQPSAQDSTPHVCPNCTILPGVIFLYFVFLKEWEIAELKYWWGRKGAGFCFIG